MCIEGAFSIVLMSERVCACTKDCERVNCSPCTLRRVLKVVDTGLSEAAEALNSSLEFNILSSPVLELSGEILSPEDSLVSDDTIVSPPASLFQPRLNMAVAGSYTNWDANPTLRFLRMRKFCSLEDLQDFVIEFKHCGFNVKANRDRVVSSYNNILRPAPFSSTTRFPVEHWVDMFNHHLTPWFEQLLNACDLPDRMLERSTTTEATSFSLNDAKRAYDKAFSKLSGMVFETDEGKLVSYGIYDRAHFEAHFSLTWQ